MPVISTTKTNSQNLIPLRTVRLAVLVAALGYFVDVYDLVLFSIVRVASLNDIGVSPENLLSDGVTLLNVQMIGMLVGGILWGVVGDKKGRIQVLFGSILLYSLANLANAFVTTVSQYAVLRFLAGIGLAGEIGAGITLVSELISKENRGYGTTIVASVGVAGGVAAGLVGEFCAWRTAYIIGGVLGLLLLLLRVAVTESGLFDAARLRQDVARGDLRMLFCNTDRFSRFIRCILVGLPVWFVVGIIISFSPEIGSALGVSEPVKVARCMLLMYVGLTLGDLASGLLSQLLKSRRTVFLVFISMSATLVTALLFSSGLSVNAYYLFMIPLGFFCGYWAIFVSAAAEQFGTNLRATVATSVPNFVRATTVPMTLSFNALRNDLGLVHSAQIVGLVACLLALYAALTLRETFAVDLDYLEK